MSSNISSISLENHNNLEMASPYITLIDPFTSKAIPCLFSDLPNGKVVYSPELKPLMGRIIDTKPAKELLNNALRHGPLKVLSADKEQAPAGGRWIMSERLILIDEEEKTSRKLGHLLFEIANSLNVEKQLKLSNEALYGLVSKQSYVKRWEQIEFETAKIFDETIMKCISNYHWSKESDLSISKLLELSGRNWERHWEIIKNSPHAELFRVDWNTGPGHIYCQKHPKKADCRKLPQFDKRTMAT